MAAVAEVVGERSKQVAKITVPFLNLLGDPMKRLMSQDSLNNDYLQEKITPNALCLVNVAGTDWMFYAPVGGYTPKGDHFQAMRWTRDYVPGPEKIPVDEGEALMFVVGNLASAMLEDPEARVIDFGWNWSPRSFGQSGYQSIPTKVHFSLFSLPDFSQPEVRDEYIELVNKSELKEREKTAVDGGEYNEYFGEMLFRALVNGQVKGDQAVIRQLLDIDTAQVSQRGIQIPIKGPLDRILRTKGVFTDLIHPVAEFMDQTMVDVSKALTDLNPEQQSRKVGETTSNPDLSEEAREAVWAEVTRTPLLLPKKDRFKNIMNLAGKYPREYLYYWMRFSEELPEEESAKDLKVGGGYMAAIHYDRFTQTGFLAISIAVKDGPGGIVEGTEHVLLQRPREELSRKTVAVKANSLKRCIDSAFDGRNGYHEFAQMRRIYPFFVNS